MTFPLCGVTSSMKNRWPNSLSFFFFPIIRCLVCLLTNFRIIRLGPFLFVGRQTLVLVLSIVTPNCLATSTTFWHTSSLCSSMIPEIRLLSLLPDCSNKSAREAPVGIFDLPVSKRRLPV